MKRCPSCSKTYTDPNLSFCVDDGTPLAEVVDDESTIIPRYRPPSGYVPPQQPPAPQKRRRVWPWILGVVAAFILGVAGLMIAAAIFVPRMVKRPVITTNVNTDHPEPTPAVPEPTESVDTPPPTDEEQVLAELRDLEHEWTVANLNADKKKLDRILADDYVDRSGEGGALKGKAEYINTIERDTQIEKWELNDLKVQLAGNRATLTGTIKYAAGGNEIELDFIDKFVWRDGRWQATGSDVKRKE